MKLIPTEVTVSFFMAELYCRTDRSGSLLGNVSNGDLVAISHTPSYHSSGQRPGTEVERGRCNEGLNKTKFHKVTCITKLCTTSREDFSAQTLNTHDPCSKLSKYV